MERMSKIEALHMDLCKKGEKLKIGNYIYGFFI